MTSRLLSLTGQVLRLRDSGAQTQREGDEEQSHLGSLSANASHFPAYEEMGVGERRRDSKDGGDDDDDRRKVLLSLLQRCARGFACRLGSAPSSLVKVLLRDQVGAKTPGSSRLSVGVCVCV